MAVLVGAVVLCVVLLMVLLVVRARRRRVGGEEQVGDDEAMRPQVLDNLHRLEAQWDEHTHAPAEPPVERTSARRDPVVEARHGAGETARPSGEAQPPAAGTDRRRPVLRGLLVVLVLVAALGTAAMVWASTH